MIAASRRVSTRGTESGNSGSSTSTSGSPGCIPARAARLGHRSSSADRRTRSRRRLCQASQFAWAISVEPPTGTGTGFYPATDHIPEFNKRGMCARDPKRTLADGIDMRVPRVPLGANEFKPHSPAATLTYGHPWRLFRSPNDAFVAANTHREGTALVDMLQPAWAGLHSGA